MWAMITTTELPISAKKLPQGSGAAEAWDEMFSVLGMAPLTAEEAAAFPPCTEEEEKAFERAINEACEQIEEPRTFPEDF